MSVLVIRSRRIGAKAVKAVHRYFKPLIDRNLDCIGRCHDESRYPVLFRTLKPLQDIVGQFHVIATRAANSETNPPEVRSIQRLDHRSNAVMSPMSTVSS